MSKKYIIGIKVFDELPKSCLVCGFGGRDPDKDTEYMCELKGVQVIYKNGDTRYRERRHRKCPLVRLLYGKRNG